MVLNSYSVTKKKRLPEGLDGDSYVTLQLLCRVDEDHVLIRGRAGRGPGYTHILHAEGRRKREGVGQGTNRLGGKRTNFAFRVMFGCR